MDIRTRMIGGPVGIWIKICLNPKARIRRFIIGSNVSPEGFERISLKFGVGSRQEFIYLLRERDTYYIFKELGTKESRGIMNRMEDNSQTVPTSHKKVEAYRSIFGA
jgi:hypothetical protein